MDNLLSITLLPTILFLIFGFIIFYVIYTFYKENKEFKNIINNIKVGQFYEVTYYDSNPFNGECGKFNYLCVITDIKFNHRLEKYVMYRFKDGSGESCSAEHFIVNKKFKLSNKSFEFKNIKIND